VDPASAVRSAAVVVDEGALRGGEVARRIATKMHLGLLEGWKARKQRADACPQCAGARLRYSRRHYDGAAARFLKLRPVKCLDCGVYFPVASRRSIPAQVDLINLHVPFRPVELDDPIPSDSGDVQRRPRTSEVMVPGGRKCPDCGARAARPVRGGDPPSFFRPDALELYRCPVCNGSFKLTNIPRLVFLLMILCVALAGPMYFMNRRKFFSGGTTSPKIRRTQVPKVAPPVLR